MSRTKLKPQREWRKQLEFFRKLQWSIRGIWTIAFPSFEPLLPMVTGGMAIIIYHIKYVTLHPVCWERNFIMGAVNIQVIIDAHIHSVVTMMEPGITLVPVDCIPI